MSTVVINGSSNVDALMRLHQPNAYLSYVRDDGSLVYFYLWVMQYNQTHTLSGTTLAQSLRFNHFYGRSYAPGQVGIEGRLPNQTQMDALGSFVHDHHLRMINARGSANLASSIKFPLMQFGLPKDNFYSEGWIPTFGGNEKRFNPAPPFQFNFLVVKDRHSTVDGAIPSSALRRWWTGDMIDNGPIDDTSNVPGSLPPGFVTDLKSS